MTKGMKPARAIGFPENPPRAIGVDFRERSPPPGDLESIP